MRKFISLLILIGIPFFIYRDWFSFNLYSYGDYVYYTKENLLSLVPFSVWRGNFGLGGFDSLFWRLPQYIIYVIGARAGFEFNVIDRFLVMWPWVILSSFSVYFLLGHYKFNERAKVIGSFIFAFNTYFLSISTQGHLLISIASCFSVMTLLFFIKLIDTKKLLYIPLVSIFLSLTSMYDLRFWYITSFLLFLYFIFRLWVDKKHIQGTIVTLIKIAAVYCLYILLNLYWIVPTLMSGDISGGTVLKRTLFGNEFLDINYSYSLFHPFWTGGQPAWFENQKIFWLTWILPIFALFGFITGRHKAFIAFFGLLGVLGVFLTKQTSIPFSGAYEWLFTYLPGFSAFREASKFYYIVALSYGVLIAFLVQYASELKGKYGKKLVWVIMGLVILLLSWNVKPVITKEIGSLFIKRTIHKDYKIFYDYLNRNEEYFRVAWLPRPSKWHNATLIHPQISIMDMLGTDWDEYRPSAAVERYDRGKGPEIDIGVDFINSEIGQNLLSSVSVKYLVLPVEDFENADDSYAFYGLSEDGVYNKIKKSYYLKEVDIGTERLRVFENLSHSSHFMISQDENSLDFSTSSAVFSKMISPSEYQVEMKNITAPFYLIFSEKYSSLWMMHLGNLSTHDFKNINKGTIISSRPNNSMLNVFFIDPAAICSGQSLFCEKNQSGLYTINASVIYKPQFGYYLGSTVSIGGWIFALLFTLFLIYRRK